MEADLENLILSSLTLSDFHHSAVISKFNFSIFVPQKKRICGLAFSKLRVKLACFKKAENICAKTNTGPLKAGLGLLVKL